jgi:hypothetical protein
VTERGGEVKYYLYVSDAKLEMLYAQMPARMRDKIAAELKIDLKIIGATISAKSRPETRYGKLDLVREYLSKTTPVGTVADPQSYFAGTMSMRWGLITGPDTGRIVYFGGEQDSAILGLAGSRHHVVGFQGEGIVDSPPPSGGGSSMVPYILEQLENSIATALEGEASAETGSVIHLKNPGSLPRSDSGDARALETVLYATRNLLGPAQSLEFLAKRLLMGRMVSSSEEINILLGSPLYVALAD